MDKVKSSLVTTIFILIGCVFVYLVYMIATEDMIKEKYEYGNTYIIRSVNTSNASTTYSFCLYDKGKDCTDISEIRFNEYKSKILNMQEQKNKIELDNKLLKSDIKGSI